MDIVPELYSLFSDLYDLVRDQRSIMANTSTDGHQFEDKTTELIYLRVRKLGIRPNPPRYTLRLPTVSGVSHQFDVSFKFGNTLYLVECKKRVLSAKDHIFYFSSKIFDYLLEPNNYNLDRIRGILFSTVPVGNTSLQYALAYGFTIIDPLSPPIEHLLKITTDQPVLNRMLADFCSNLLSTLETLKMIPSYKNANHLVKEYQFLCKRCGIGHEFS